MANVNRCAFLAIGQVVSPYYFRFVGKKQKKHTQQEARRDYDYDCTYRLCVEVNYHLGA